MNAFVANDLPADSCAVPGENHAEKIYCRKSLYRDYAIIDDFHIFASKF
jgi:hypothetical protein